MRINTHGISLFTLDRLDEAAESFRRTLELDPGHKHAHRNMAETRMRQGRLVESIRWYREALDVDPEPALAHAGLGEVLFRVGQHQPAVKSLEQAVSLRPDAVTISTLYFLAEALRKQQRHEEAIERYRDVLKIDREFAYAHAGIGTRRFN